MDRTATRPFGALARPFLLALGTAALLAAPAAADFVGASLVDVSAEVDTPDGLVTWRVVAHFDEPAPRLIGVSTGSSFWTPPHRLRIGTTDPAGFRNDAGALAGTPADDFPNAPVGAAWDSWLSLGATALGGPEIFLFPNVFAGDPPHVTGDRIVSDLGGGWVIPAPPYPEADGPDVVLAQLTVGAGHDVWFEGNVLHQRSGGESARDPISVRTGAAPAIVVGRPCGRADQDGDGRVGFEDLLRVLDRWGPAPAAWQPDGGSFDASVVGIAAFDELPCVPWPRTAIARGEGFGAWDGDAAIELEDGVRAASSRATVSRAGDDTVIRLEGAVHDALDGGCLEGDSFATASGELCLLVTAPLAFTFEDVVCDEGADVRLRGPVTFEELVCTDGGGVLVPGSYWLRGGAFADLDGGERATDYRATLRLHDGGAWSDVDGDGLVGFGDVVALLADWGDCGP